MSYLTSDGVADFSQAVISFWFRVPQESIDAAFEAYDPTIVDPAKYDPLNGVITLVVMGTKGTLANGGPSAPTFIGVDCRSEDNAFLSINFETNQKPTVSDYTRETSTVSTSAHSKLISADQWHHVLVSIDFTSIETHGFAWDEPFTEEAVNTTHVDNVAHLYMAFDDVNLTGADLSGNYPYGNNDLNAVLDTYDAIAVANAVQLSEQAPGEPEHAAGGIPQYSSGDKMTIPTGKSALGIPGTVEFVNDIYRVEMAEFQMWTDVVLDTSSEVSRRVFVDADGKPVPPTGTEEDPRGPAEILLDKAPSIVLHGNSNWIAGINTGSGGQFQPIGGIESYSPDPSLQVAGL